jgi:anti-anti-sigma factor
MTNPIKQGKKGKNVMDIQKKKEQQLLIVTVTGRLDAVSAPAFEENLSQTLAEGETRLLLDFSGLQYISSAGLRSLLVLTKKLKAVQGELCFSGIQGPVAEVFKISGFNTLFKIFDSPDAALS